MKESKIPKQRYLVVDENGDDMCDYLYTEQESAEKDAEDFVNNNRTVVYICKVTPFMKISSGNIQKTNL